MDEPASKERPPSHPIGSGPPREPTNLVDLYLEYTKDLPSPAVFRQWAAIHAIGAAAERRIWTQFGNNKLHANLFVFLVSPPGIGKSQAINPMSEILRKSTAAEMAPNDMTKQGLLDALTTCGRGTVINGRPFDYHFMAICISELSNFMSKYDTELTGLLTDLFDCPPVNEEKKRSGAGKTIPSPGISFLMGTATQNLGNTISNEMWGSGFMARVIMVYSADEIIPEDMFEVKPQNEALRDEMVTGLRRLSDFKGPMEWEAAARSALKTFRINQADGAPLHNRLTFYVTRRWMHLAKLCMIAALSDERMVVRVEDFDTALGWLMAAEHEMPEIFKDMATHEDGQIYEEMRSALFAVHIAANRAPIERSVMYKFLSTRVATHAVERTIQVAIAADMFRRVAGEEDQFIPQPPKGSVNLGVM